MSEPYLEQDTFLINTTSSKILNIVADSTPIYENAKIKIAFPKQFSEFAWDGMFWILVPPNLRAGYIQIKNKSTSAIIGKILSDNISVNELTTIPSNLFDYKFSHENNQHVITIEMLDTLPIGDTLQIIYGANGSPTYTYSSMISYKDKFTVLIDNLYGSYKVINTQPEIIYKYSVARSINLSINSKCKINQSVPLKLTIHDLGKNFAEDFVGTVKISCTDATAMSEQTIAINELDKGRKSIDVFFTKNGIFRIIATLIVGNQNFTGTFYSNPIQISNDSLNIYWGELHTHTKFSRDGLGDMAYNYAKYGIGLDFYSGTDHADFNSVDTFGINPIEWNQLKSESVLVQENDRFVSFLGYENSLDNPSGHYNFIYNYDNSDADAIPMLPRHFYFTIQNLWQKLNTLNKQGKVLTIPHHTGKLFGAIGVDAMASGFGGTLANSTYKTLIEIYSGHGQSEYYNPNHALAYERFGGRSSTYPCYAQDAWSLSEKLGVIASTDSHNGRMAQSNVGLTAIIADSLNRNTLFESMKVRHTYATSGEKMILDFKIANKIMGDELLIASDSFPTIYFNVIGTDAIDFIELLKWDFKNGKYTINPVHPIYNVLTKKSFAGTVTNYSFAYIDTTLNDSSLYYVRVKQKNNVSNREVWAWSSPIWVNKLNNNTLYNSDSLYNFNLENNTSGVRVNWCMNDEFNTNYFVIERSSGDSTHFVSLDTVQTIHIAFYDSCYSYLDQFPNDSILFYRIKMIGYNDSIKYSNILNIIVFIILDSIYDLNLYLESDKINVNWYANEFEVQSYSAEKGKRNIPFQSFENKIPTFLNQPNTYSISDYLPLKDTSIYRVIMNLSDGTFLISNLDTLIFRIDSLFAFRTDLFGSLVTANWKSEHEKETLKYELQRSQDNNIFYTVETVYQTGALFDTATYTYSDTSALPGWNYYRILQYLSDGTIKISTTDSEYIISTTTTFLENKMFDINIIDNLIDEGHTYLQILTTTPQDIKGTFLIINTAGKLEFNINYILNKGNSIQNIPIGNLASGSYYLIFMSNDLIIKNKFMIVFHGGCEH